MRGPREALRQARKAAGLTQKRAAQLAGYSGTSSWAMVELGYATPRIDQMRAIAKALGVKPSDIFEELREEDGDHGPAA